MKKTKKKRLWTTAIAAATFAIGGLGIAGPATAAVTGNVAVSGSGTVSVTWSGGATAWTVQGDGDVINVCSAISTVCDSAQSGNIGYIKLTGGSTSITLTENTDINVKVNGVWTTRALGAGTYTIQMLKLTQNQPDAPVEGRFIVSVGGSSAGDGGASSTANASEPAEVSLSLDLAASGASCKDGSAASGLVGTWLALPSAGDCTSKAAPDAKLLGWATTADFPVEIAQRQVRNGWGAYEMFDNEGRMTAVFIPAGQATFVSGSNSLYPIWAR